MKTTTLLFAATVAAKPKSLLNLRNHSLLSSNTVVSPLESIALVETFEDVPVFGGYELREQMLNE